MESLNSTQILLSGKDIRAMVGIVSEVAASPGDHPEKKRLLMDSLCSLLNADAWSWVLATSVKPGQQPVYTSVVSGGFEEGRFSNLLVAQEHVDFAKLTEPLARNLNQSNTQVTLLSSDYDPDGFFADCESHHLWKSADCALPLLCYRPVPNGNISGVALYRKYDGRPFNLRHSKIAHIVLEEVSWLHEQGWPWSSAAKVPELTNRCRQVLNLLLEGLSRKEVADRLGISEHTVNDYAKEVYKFFGVHSHAELVSKFRAGSVA